MDIKQKEQDERGYFVVEENNQIEAEISYTLNGKDRLIIDHTTVSEKLSGKGVGKQLVEKVVAYAREKHYKIVPRCTYARKVLIASDDYKDVLAPGSDPNA